MIGELGQLALCFALALSLVMAAAGLMGARPGAGRVRRGAWRAPRRAVRRRAGAVPALGAPCRSELLGDRGGAVPGEV